MSPLDSGRTDTPVVWEVASRGKKLFDCIDPLEKEALGVGRRRALAFDELSSCLVSDENDFRLSFTTVATATLTFATGLTHPGCVMN